jgi:hypothetical protein
MIKNKIAVEGRARGNKRNVEIGFQWSPLRFRQEERIGSRDPRGGAGIAHFPLANDAEIRRRPDRFEEQGETDRRITVRLPQARRKSCLVTGSV